MCGWPRGDLMNGAASLIGRAGVEAGLECSTDGVQVAVARGREGPFADAVVDGGLERPPACETVLAGDEQLGVGQLCGGILDSHFLEALLGIVPEMLEDNLPSFAGHSPAVCPASANLGQEVRLC